MHHFPAIDDVYSAIKSNPPFEWSSFPSLGVAQQKQFITELFDAATCTAPPDTLLEVLNSLAACPWLVFEFIMSLAERHAQSSPVYAEKFHSVVLLCALQFPAGFLVSEKRFCRWVLHHIRSLAQSDKQITSRVINNDKFVEVVGNLFMTPNTLDLLECFQILLDVATYAVLDYKPEADNFSSRSRFSVTKECCWHHLKLARRRLGLALHGSLTIFPHDPDYPPLDDTTDVDMRYQHDLLWYGKMLPLPDEATEFRKAAHRLQTELTPQYLILKFVCHYYDEKLRLGKILACEVGSNTAADHPARMTEQTLAQELVNRRYVRLINVTSATDPETHILGDVFQRLYQVARVDNRLQPFLLLDMPQCDSYQFQSLFCDIYSVAGDFDAFQRTWICQLVLSSLESYAKLSQAHDEARQNQQNQLLQSIPPFLLQQVQYQLAGFYFNQLHARQQKDAGGAGDGQLDFPVAGTISMLFELFDKLKAAAVDEQKKSNQHVGDPASSAISKGYVNNSCGTGGAAAGEIKFVSVTKADIVEYFTHGFIMLLSNSLLLRHTSSSTSQRRDIDSQLTDTFLSSVLVLSQASWPRYANMLRSMPNVPGPSYLPVLDIIAQRRKFSFPQFFTYIYELDLLEEFAQLARLDLPLRQAVPPSEQIVFDILPLQIKVEPNTGINNGNGVAAASNVQPLISTSQQVVSTVGGSLRTRGKSSEEREELKAAFEMQCRSATAQEPGISSNGKTLNAVEALFVNERSLLERILSNSCC